MMQQPNRYEGSSNLAKAHHPGQGDEHAKKVHKAASQEQSSAGKRGFVEHNMTEDAVVKPPPFTDVHGNPDAYEVDKIVDHRS